MSVLRTWFGPSKDEIWRQLAGEMGAQFVDGGTWKGDKVQASHGEWTITLDTFSVHAGKVTMIFTRLRAPYVNPDHFRFTIYHRGVFTWLAKLLGAQDIEIGEKDFDRDFVIKGTSAAKLRMLFEDVTLREMIAAQPEIQLTVKDNEGWLGPEFPSDTDELYLTIHGIIRDVEQLKALFALFARLLDQLCRIGSAYEQAPRVKL